MLYRQRPEVGLPMQYARVKFNRMNCSHYTSSCSGVRSAVCMVQIHAITFGIQGGSKKVSCCTVIDISKARH